MMTSVVNGFENRRPITYELSCMIYVFFICVLWILNVQHISPMVAVRCLPRQQEATELSFDTKRGGCPGSNSSLGSRRSKRSGFLAWCTMHVSSAIHLVLLLSTLNQ